MYSAIKRFIVRVFVALFGQLTENVLQLLAKSQLSPNVIIRGLGYLPFQLVDAVLGMNVLRFIGHVARREPKRRQHIRNRKLRSFLYLSIGKLNKQKAFFLLPPNQFRVLLIEENLDPDDQYTLAHLLFQSGSLDLACVAFEDLVTRSADELALEKRLQLLRDAGITFFLIGRSDQANRYWAKAGELRRFILSEKPGPIYRIVGSSWFAAIGHVAMLDFYIKYNKLYRTREVRIVAQVDVSGVPGNYLCERFSEAGIEFIEDGRLQPDYDKWAYRHNKRRWSQLTPAERFALIDDFWEFEFPDGQVWGYTHAADKIQKEWERQQRPPLLSITDDEKLFLDMALKTLGLPEDAWYVCLHVREPGFHKNWNTLYPSMRDANIDDYLLSIKLIVENGGWVIRMGDASMKPLPRMPRVIDYAHSILKTPKADILITLGCRFFLGTNSGFATIPAIYGVRCVFSNWLPIGLPLWISKDLMQPKLFWNEKEKRNLTMEEIFSSGLAFIQNWSDLPEGITLRDNTPEEILALTEEALGLAREIPGEGIEEARAAYRTIAEQHGSYVGSTLSASFIRSHQSIFE